MRIKMYIFGGDCVGPKEPRMTARVPINGMGSLERTCTCIRHSSNSSSSADTSSLRAHWTQPVARCRGVRLQRRCRLSLPLCCYFFGFYFSTNVTAVLQRVTYTKGRSVEAVSEWYVRAQSVVLDRGWRSRSVVCVHAAWSKCWRSWTKSSDLAVTTDRARSSCSASPQSPPPTNRFTTPPPPAHPPPPRKVGPRHGVYTPQPVLQPARQPAAECKRFLSVLYCLMHCVSENKTTEREREFISQVHKSKRIPVLVYDLVACLLNKSQLSSLDFAMSRFLMKLFSSSNMEIITYCQEQFNFELPSVILARHTIVYFWINCVAATTVW